jgi:hypothetical protein
MVSFFARVPGMERGIITGVAAGLATCGRGGVRLHVRRPSVVSGDEV